MDDQPVWGTSEFGQGNHVGLAGVSMIALVEARGSSTRERLWSLVVDDAPIATILDDLSSDGLMKLPSFAIARFDGDTTTVVARGDVVIEVRLRDGTVEFIDAAGVSTWKEQQVEAAASVLLRLGAQVQPDDVFDVLAGSVPAGWIRRNLVDDHEFAEAAGSGWSSGRVEATSPPEVALASPPHGAQETPPESSPDELTADVDVDAAGDLASWQVEVSPQPREPDSGSSSQGAPAVELDAKPQSEPNGDLVSQTPPPEPKPEQQEDPVDVGRTRAPDPSMTVRGSAPDGDTVHGDVPEPGSDYDSIYGHTVHRSVESAAVREEESATPIGMISDVPGAGPPEPVAAPSAADSAADLGDHDGLTLSRSQLLAMQQQAAASPPMPGGGKVAAVMCPADHPNPLHSVNCRACGQVITSSNAVSVARPPLAVLVFSTGVRVAIDRSVLIGRNPKVTGAVAGECPHIVKFDEQGQGLSRTHAEIVLEGWQILISDLHSTNGTEVQLPGQSSRRLHPGEPAALTVGTSLDFGDGLSATLENVP